MYRADIKGLNETIKKIESYSNDLAVKVDAELEAGAYNIAVMARERAPKGRSYELANSIGFSKAGAHSYYVSAGEPSAPYAPYVEFGTGAKVFKTASFNFTPEMRAYAREFFVSGKGRTPAHPYLFPSLEIEKKNIITRIKEVLFGGSLRL